MTKYSTVVVGGGAAGICAAISRARLDRPVIICEKTDRIGKKILATGNGRCNLLNDKIDDTFYNLPARPLVKSVFERFGKPDIMNFFQELGLHLYSDDGRIFPRTNQAASVLQVLEMEIKRLRIPIAFNFDCSGITFSSTGLQVLSRSGNKVSCDNVIITGGGMSYPSFGSDGSIYQLIKNIGHTVIDPVPCVVPLVIKDSLCVSLQGQRIFAYASSIIDGKYSEPVAGELLFTKYGLSGTCILDISETVSIAVNRQHRKDIYISIDMVPFLDKSQLKNELEARQRRNLTPVEMLAGILPNKFCIALQNLSGENNIDTAVSSLKDRRFKVTGARGWNEAEFTSGGINVNEVKPGTLESKIRHGVYFAGEVLDVNGQRGGYNLAWAWASGFVAGFVA